MGDFGESLFAKARGPIPFHERIERQAGDLRHGFSSFVNEFVGTDYSILTQKYDERTRSLQPLYQLYGEIVIDGRPEPFIFDYTLNNEGVCYHRFAAKKSKIEFVNELVKQVQYTSHFPTLLQSRSSDQELVVQRNGAQYRIGVTPSSIVSFTDQGITYRLFKMC
jgi:hypothetical protein